MERNPAGVFKQALKLLCNGPLGKWKAFTLTNMVQNNLQIKQHVKKERNIGILKTIQKEISWVKQERFENCFKICVRAGSETGLFQHSNNDTASIFYKSSRVKKHSAIKRGRERERREREKKKMFVNIKRKSDWSVFTIF